MAEAFGGRAASAGKHSGEGMLGKLIKRGRVRQQEVPGKDNKGWELGGKPWQLVETALQHETSPKCPGDIPGHLFHEHIFIERAEGETVFLGKRCVRSDEGGLCRPVGLELA